MTVGGEKLSSRGCTKTDVMTMKNIILLFQVSALDIPNFTKFYPTVLDIQLVKFFKQLTFSETYLLKKVKKSLNFKTNPEEFYRMCSV